jgi:lipoic acid synthetase
MPLQRPDWLNKKIDLAEYDRMRIRLKPFALHTVCEEARCPNISECFSKGTATFLIGGDICSRACRFCGVTKGTPSALDADEATRVANAVLDLDLTYAVITGVTRDDLADKGAGHYADTVRLIKAASAGSATENRKKREIKVEVLTPDFDGIRAFVKKVVDAKPDVFAHNIETVQRLYPLLGRDEYRYDVSLSTLETVKSLHKGAVTKSAIMAGLGETEEELFEAMENLVDVGCDYLSIGQYLAPSNDHHPVQEYKDPAFFERMKQAALDMGIKDVKSGPYVRSSYLAHEYRRDVPGE